MKYPVDLFGKHIKCASCGKLITFSEKEPPEYSKYLCEWYCCFDCSTNRAHDQLRIEIVSKESFLDDPTRYGCEINKEEAQ